jgi:hypothetical protein
VEVLSVYHLPETISARKIFFDGDFFPAKFVKIEDYFLLRAYARWNINDHYAVTVRAKI